MNQIATKEKSGFPAVVIEEQIKLSKADVIELLYNESIAAHNQRQADIEAQKKQIEMTLKLIIRESIMSNIRKSMPDHASTVSITFQDFSIDHYHEGEMGWVAVIEGLIPDVKLEIHHDCRHSFKLAADLDEAVKPHIAQFLLLHKEGRKIEAQLRNLDKNKSSFKHEIMKRMLEQSAEGRSLLDDMKRMALQVKVQVPSRER